MKRYQLRERQHPIFSPVAILSALLFITALSVGLYLKGGSAFSPGDLSALPGSGAASGGFPSHFDFQDDCGQCHEPFQGISADLCERCHRAIKTQRETGSGTHGKIAAVELCGQCHKDHLGTEADLLMASLDRFDHRVTRFSLVKHGDDYQGRSIACADCHDMGSQIAFVEKSCYGCHSAQQPDFMNSHIYYYGSNCIGCHDGLDSMAGFEIDDHASVFPLEGAHAEANCENCHVEANFTELPTTCQGCHAEPTAHAGFFTGGCTDCHTSDAWRPARLRDMLFSHANAPFVLTTHQNSFDGLPIRCDACHTTDLSLIAASCEGCHTAAQAEYMAGHIAAVGSACLNCHNGSGESATFNHDQVWPLLGRHQEVACLSCHTASRMSPEPRPCEACHQEPQIHFGAFGTDCGACHTAAGWLPAQLSRHAFPLNHGGGTEVECTICHPSSYVVYTCYGCHDHQPADIEEEHQEEGIVIPELNDCARCHPTGTEADTENS